MFFWLTAMLLAVSTVAAEEDTRPDNSSTASSPAAVKRAVPETVELLDGADSAEDALTAFVAASKAADDQAALLMVDPPIRRLLYPEIVIEKTTMDSTVMELAMFGEDKNAIGGILFHCAQRELINIQSIEVIHKSAVDADRIIFTILSTGPSYHNDGDMRIVQDFLAIRRSEKWYVFIPLGIMKHLFRMNTDAANGGVELLDVRRGTDEKPNRRNADFEMVFSVPFEKVHAELVRASESAEIAESMVLADRLDRLRNSIVNRAKRNEYTTRTTLSAAFQQISPLIRDVRDRQETALHSALLNLSNASSKESPNPANH